MKILLWSIKKNKINTTGIILKENTLLIELILEIQEKTRLSNKEISEFLGIGKNRITNLKKLLNCNAKYDSN